MARACRWTVVCADGLAEGQPRWIQIWCELDALAVFIANSDWGAWPRRARDAQRARENRGTWIVAASETSTASGRGMSHGLALVMASIVADHILQVSRPPIPRPPPRASPVAIGLGSALSLVALFGDDVGSDSAALISRAMADRRAVLDHAP